MARRSHERGPIAAPAVSRDDPRVAYVLACRLRLPRDLSLATLKRRAAQLAAAGADDLPGLLQVHLAGLLALTSSKLEEVYLEEKAKSEVQAAWRQATETIRRIERLLSRRDVVADLTFWSKMPTWTLDEWVALSFGWNPMVVTPAALAPYGDHLYDFARDFHLRREMVKRSRDVGLLTDPVSPSDALAWADRFGITYPPELPGLVAVQRAAPPVAPVVQRKPVDAKEAIQHGNEPMLAAAEKSGFGGRPSASKHLIEDEHERRVKDKVAMRRLKDEAEWLYAWFKEKYPTLQRPQPKSIANAIRARHGIYRELLPRNPDPRN